MKTAFSEARMDFTKRAHLAAQGQFYARMFPHRKLAFEDTVNTVRDLEYAIDCYAAVTVQDLHAPLRFAIQERWREPEHMHYGDITITEWNTASGQPSELHKFGAHLFVYGFYDKAADRILFGVALNVAIVLRRLAAGDLKYTRRSRLDQSFLALKFPDLCDVGAVMFSVDNRGLPHQHVPI